MNLATPEVRAFIFGIVLASAVGPIALLIATNSLRFGLAVGIQSAFGAALGDLTYAILALSAGAIIAPALAAHTRELHIGGSAVLVAFGVYMIVDARRTHTPDALQNDQTASRLGALLSTYALTVINPLTIIVFVGFIAQLPVGLRTIRLGFVALSLFAGSLAVQLSLALAGSTLRRWLNEERWVQRINIASGIGIALFGLSGFVSGSQG